MGLLDLFRPTPRAQDRFEKRFRIHGTTLDVVDVLKSVAPTIAHELKIDSYGLKKIRFTPGDVVIDIGGHVGLVSIYLAKRHPQITVYAFEALPPNYEIFKENIVRNGVTNIVLENLAVTADGRDFHLMVHPDNTGGASGQQADMAAPTHDHYTVKSVTLDGIFERYGIERCKFLKIDCEGSEHEILHAAHVLDRIDWLSGEFHINAKLAGEGYSIDGLAEYLARYIPRDHITYEPCRMAD
jgi:FkbM family methyltransferase